MTSKLVHEYVTWPLGEIHLRSMRGAGQGRPLLCLHPAPYSGFYFESFMPLLRSPAHVLAPDYPGYGGSSAPAQLPSIQDYAAAMLAVLDALDIQQVDILGFHTGCLVAAEMALQYAPRVARLVLVDVPYFTGVERDAMYAAAAQAPVLTDDYHCLEKSFRFNVTRKLDHVDYARAFALFLEQLRPGSKSHWAFHAAFSYEADLRFAELHTPGMVLATQSGLLEPTREAAAVLKHMSSVERPDIQRSVFEESAAQVAAEVDNFLTGAAA